VDLADATGGAGLTAYTLMRNSNVLAALGEGQRANLAARRAASLAARKPPARQAVCPRQVGLSEAGQGNEAAARDAIERVLILSSSPSDGLSTLSPYCTPAYVKVEHAPYLLVLDQPTAAVQAWTRLCNHGQRISSMARAGAWCGWR
jgi:hypothetical protein